MAEILRDMQTRFLAGILGGGGEAEALIVDDGRVGARRRLDIYRNNYRASLTGVLADHYERLHIYLGDEQFDGLARGFVAAHPSATRNLRYYGREFAAFLAENHPADGELAELAEIDWALRNAFDAPDAPVLDAVGVGAIGEAWIMRPLTLHPSVRLLTVRHNVAAIWRALSGEEEPPAVERLTEPVRLLVWRGGEQPSFRSLYAEEADMLFMLSGQANFMEVSARAIDRLGEAAATKLLAGWLGVWLADGVLTGAD